MNESNIFPAGHDDTLLSPLQPGVTMACLQSCHDARGIVTMVSHQTPRYVSGDRGHLSHLILSRVSLMVQTPHNGAPWFWGPDTSQYWGVYDKIDADRKQNIYQRPARDHAATMPRLRSQVTI